MVYLRSSQIITEVPHHVPHIRHLQNFEKKGLIFIGGSKYPTTGADIFVECDEKSQLEDFVADDPFIKNGLVTDHTIEEVKISSSKGLKDLKGTLNYRPI